MSVTTVQLFSWSCLNERHSPTDFMFYEQQSDTLLQFRSQHDYKLRPVGISSTFDATLDIPNPLTRLLWITFTRSLQKNDVELM